MPESESVSELPILFSILKMTQDRQLGHGHVKKRVVHAMPDFLSFAIRLLLVLFFLVYKIKFNL